MHGVSVPNASAFQGSTVLTFGKRDFANILKVLKL